MIWKCSLATAGVSKDENSSFPTFQSVAAANPRYELWDRKKLGSQVKMYSASNAYEMMVSILAPYELQCLALKCL